MNSNSRTNAYVPRKSIYPTHSHFEQAISILRQQNFVPKSPGCTHENGIALCAGAALVAATLEAEYSTNCRFQFEQNIAFENGMLCLYDAVERLGWSDWAVKEVIIKNDSFSLAVRKKMSIELLQAMAEKIGSNLVYSGYHVANGPDSSSRSNAGLLTKTTMC
jgi:hypothetical protein